MWRWARRRQWCTWAPALRMWPRMAPAVRPAADIAMQIVRLDFSMGVVSAMDMLIFGFAATSSRLATEPAMRRAGKSLITPDKHLMESPRVLCRCCITVHAKFLGTEIFSSVYLISASIPGFGETCHTVQCCAIGGTRCAGPCAKCCRTRGGGSCGRCARVAAKTIAMQRRTGSTAMVAGMATAMQWATACMNLCQRQEQVLAFSMSLRNTCLWHAATSQVVHVP